MAETIRVLAQSAPAATTLTAVYTVSAATTATVSTLTVCNRSATAATFRISVAINGAADATAQYIFYDQALAGNSTYAATIGMTLGANDIIRVYASTANLSVNVFGVEVS